MRWQENRSTRLQLDPLLVDLNKPIPAMNTNDIPANPLTSFGTQGDSNQQKPMNFEAVKSNQLFSDLEIVHRFTEIEALIQRIPGVPTPIKRSTANSFSNSPFVDEIALMEMSKKFNFPNMKQYDRTTDPDDHITHYKQTHVHSCNPKGPEGGVYVQGIRFESYRTCTLMVHESNKRLD